MRELKGLVPALVVLVIIGVTAALAPLVAREVSYAIDKGQWDAARDALVELNDENPTLGHGLRLAARTARPAVVEIRIRGKGQDRSTTGLGSGVIVDADRGLAVTNYHVVELALEEQTRSDHQVEVFLHDGRKFLAQWARGDKHTDMAVVKIKPTRLFSIGWGDSDQVEVADQVLAIGAPDGLAQSVTFGIISAKQRTGVGDTASYRDFLQTDAAINKGNSGGPLINLRGEVIGINTAIHSRSGGNEGIGFAIPSNMARQIYRQLVEEGRVAHGFVGVIMREIDEIQANRFRLPHNRGVQITKLVEGGPADQAGLEEDDFLVSINGREVRKSSDVVSVIAQLPPGREADLVFYREGRKQRTVVTVGQRPQDIISAFSGLITESLTPALIRRWNHPPDSRGALVTRVIEDSPADHAGLQRGMVVTHANGRQIDSAAELRAFMASPLARSGLRLRVRTPRGVVIMVTLDY